MARCVRDECRRWRPDLLAKRGWVGVVLDDGWFCSSRCLREALQRRLGQARVGAGGETEAVPPPKLGVLLLVGQSAVTPAHLREALDGQKLTGLRLGAQLQRMGVVSSQEVVETLATQAGVGYLGAIDTARVSNGPGGLSRDVVRSLGLVPFEADASGKRLKVACVAPLPRLSIGALTELTGWTVEPFVVSDELWPALLAAYGTLERRVAATDAPRLSPFTEATARIAQAADGTHDVRMPHTRIDPYLWVRLEGGGYNEDLLLPVPDELEEDPWPAKPTSH